MIHSIEKTMRYLLPTLFVGYACLANVSLLSGNVFSLDRVSGQSFLSGTVIRELETAYKTKLPHRDPSIGFVGALRYLVLGAGKPGVVVGNNDWFFTKEEFAGHEKMDTKHRRAIREVEYVQSQLAARGIKLVLAPIPYKSDLYSEHLQQGQAEIATDSYKRFLTDLKSSNITAVDTREALGKAKQRQVVFFKSDTHWTPQGSKAAAAVIGDTVAETVQLESKTFNLSLEERKPFWGDLSGFITNEDYRPMAGLKQETAEIWLAEEGENSKSLDLFGTDEAFQVVLIGTSYSADPSWSFAEFLKKELEADVLNLAVKGKGPAAPMYDFLKSDILTDAPPQVVIWEFPVRYLAQETIWDDRPVMKSAGGEMTDDLS